MTLVVGIGSPDRGDDAIGPVVAAAVAAQLADEPAGSPDGSSGTTTACVVQVHEDPSALLDAIVGHDRVVIVDGVVSGSEPGTVHRIRLGGEPALDPRTAIPSGASGTHDVGVADALALAAALGRLPRYVTVVGVELGQIGYGAPLSAGVAAAVPAAVAAVRDEITARNLPCV
jgi:hydrogenase maturation protease